MNKSENSGKNSDTYKKNFNNHGDEITYGDNFNLKFPKLPKENSENIQDPEIFYSGRYSEEFQAQNLKN